MLTILLNWAYMLFTCFCIGFFFAWSAEKALRYSVKRLDSILMAGLVMATVYAQTVSLFCRVGIEANVALTVASIAGCIALRRRMWVFLKENFSRASLARKLLVPAAFLLWSFFSSRGYMVPDMDLYHGQSIRWIEEYGAVKGLGNLNSRFGYNSSLFAVSALYSMKFLLGRSLHAVNGFIAFVLTLAIFDFGEAFRRRRMWLSDYARAGAAYYLTLICDEVIAPSSDYATMCTIFFIVIKWLSQLEREEEQERGHIAPYALLCVAGVYALTLKLSAGLILLLTVKPACMLIKEKRWREIAFYLGLGLAAAVPWMARTVVITGWLFFPFASLDLFSVDWKIIDEGLIRSDAYLIKAWARTANVLEDTSLRSWFPHWFQTALSPMEKLLIVADFLSCAEIAVIVALTFIKKRWERLDVLLVMISVGGSYLFWQFVAPMVRYGYAYMLLLAAIAGGYVLEKTKRAEIVYLGFCLYGIYKLYACCSYTYSALLAPNYIWSETYGRYELESTEIKGITFYYSPFGGSTGYEAFPASSVDPEIELRGDCLEEGFRPK